MSGRVPPIHRCYLCRQWLALLRRPTPASPTGCSWSCLSTNAPIHCYPWLQAGHATKPSHHRYESTCCKHLSHPLAHPANPLPRCLCLLQHATPPSRLAVAHTIRPLSLHTANDSSPQPAAQGRSRRSAAVACAHQHCSQARGLSVCRLYRPSTSMRTLTIPAGAARSEIGV